MNRYSILFLFAIASVVSIIALVSRNSILPPTAQRLPSVRSTAHQDVTAPVQQAQHFLSSKTATTLLTTLQDTTAADIDIPHSLNVDANGNLVLNEGVRELIEFFLALDGERSANEIRSLFMAAAQTQCNDTCATQAIAIYDRYLTYLDAMQSATFNVQETDDLRARIEMVNNLRSTLLGTELEQALFGYEDQYDKLRAEQWAIHNNPELSTEEKKHALEELQLSQPTNLTRRELQTRIPQSVHQLAQQLDSQNADMDTRQRAYTDVVGPEAAERLMALEQSRQAWDVRYQQYRAERHTVESAGLSQEDQAQELERLRLRFFSQQESLRVAALDRIRAETH